MTLFNYLSTSALTLLGAAQLFAQTTAKSNLTEPACALIIGEPVYCNTDGKVYRNLCYAIKRNPANAAPGACVRVPDGSTIPRVAMPNGTDQAVEVAHRSDTDCAYTIGQQVYCTDGRLYQNLCFAIKRNPANAAPGACTHVPDGSTIPRVAMPNGTDQAVEIARRSDYACLDVYDPVCANGITYGNACYASLAGVTSWAKGACGSAEAEYRTAPPATTTDAIAVDCLYDPTVRIYCSSTGLYYRDACAARKAGATGCYPVSNPDVPRVAMPTNETQTTISSLRPIDQTECERTVNEDVYCVKGGHFDNMCLANKANAVGCVWVGDGSSTPRVAMPTDEAQTIEVARRPDYHCIDVYAPVCANGVTYGNSCYASLAGETSWTKGACDGSDSPVEFRQANHSNSTAAIRLRPDYDCLAVYDPVCANGVTYGNSCYASLAGVTSWTKGACESEVLANISIRPRPCPMIYAPVCGNDGITYANSCIAREAGVTSWTNGACDKAELELRKGSANGFSNDYRVLVYPNPTSTIVNVQIQDAAAQSIRLYNIAGQLVREQQNINTNQVEISVADLANGIYTISVITEKGIRNERVQVQH